MLSIVLAHDLNNVLGFNNRMPWHNQRDLDLFFRRINKEIIIVGRQTYLSLPKIMPAKIIYVLSRSSVDLIHPQATIIHDVMPYLKKWCLAKKKYYVCGGGQIFELLYKYCSTMYITTIKESHTGDIYFNPKWIEGLKVLKKSENSDFDLIEYIR